MHKVLRVVIDTNHIISAILSSRGASAKLIDWMTDVEDYFMLLLSQPIWDEYNTVADWLIPDTKKSEKERIMNALFTHSDPKGWPYETGVVFNMQMQLYLKLKCYVEIMIYVKYMNQGGSAIFTGQYHA